MEYQTKSKANLKVISDKNDASFVVFDEEKGIILWVRSSEYGDGVAIDKMGWGTTFDVLYDDKIIIRTYNDSSLDDDEEECK